LTWKPGYPATRLLHRCEMETGRRDLCWGFRKVQEGHFENPESSHFSPSERVTIHLPFPLSHAPPASIGNSIQEPLCRGGGVNGFPSFLSLSFYQQHRESQHIHLAVSLSVERCLGTANQNK
jgi:hypothetical protein